MAKSFLEKFVESPTNMRRFQQERAILEATGEICLALEAEGLNRADLAERLGKTAGWVTQLLDGKKNKTIRTIADVLAVLNREMHISSRPIQTGAGSARQSKPSAARISEDKISSEFQIYRIGEYQLALSDRPPVRTEASSTPAPVELSAVH